MAVRSTERKGTTACVHPQGSPLRHATPCSGTLRPGWPGACGKTRGRGVVASECRWGRQGACSRGADKGRLCFLSV